MNPSEQVMAYLRARQAWERRASSIYADAVADGRVDEGLDHIQRDYEALLSDFCSQRLLNRGPRAAFSDPPAVDPASARVESVAQSDQSAIVVTTEVEHSPSGRRRFEYALRRESDSWMIEDRRTRDTDGRWIHRVL